MRKVWSLDLPDTASDMVSPRRVLLERMPIIVLDEQKGTSG
jgi:hypothetical protein